MQRLLIPALALTFVALGLAAAVAGPETATTTTITIPEMHCNNCGKKIATKAVAVKGVAKASADAEKKLLTVVAKDNSKVSPKALWEAVVDAGFEPTKLVGPSGTFTEKPKD